MSREEKIRCIAQSYLDACDIDALCEYFLDGQIEYLETQEDSFIDKEYEERFEE